jgi:hypothetical protein
MDENTPCDQRTVGMYDMDVIMDNEENMNMCLVW